MKKVILTMFAVLAGITLSYAESCKDSPVQTEYKTEDSDCGFKKRTCCEDGTWSDWDAECEKHEGCFNGTTWEKEPDPSTEYETNYIPEETQKSLDTLSNVDSGYGFKWRLESEKPFKYKRTSCKCENGKGWMCTRNYGNVNYIGSFAYMRISDLRNQDGGRKERAYWGRINYGNDGGSYELGDRLFNLLNPPEGGSYNGLGYEANNRNFMDITNSVNWMGTCKYLISLVNKSNQGYVSVHADVIPQIYYYNATVNGHQGQLDYTIHCRSGYLSGPYIRETDEFLQKERNGSY